MLVIRADLVDAMVAHARADHPDEGVVEFRLDPLPEATGDRSLLHEVLTNLFSNALKYSHGCEKPCIRMSGWVDERECVYEIEDNGSGFPEQMKSRVFEPYVTTKQKGTGLGLSIVKKIIEDHGSSVAIENVKPHGAKVSIDLPRRTDAGPRVVAAG